MSGNSGKIKTSYWNFVIKEDKQSFVFDKSKKQLNVGKIIFIVKFFFNNLKYKFFRELKFLSGDKFFSMVRKKQIKEHVSYKSDTVTKSKLTTFISLIIIITYQELVVWKSIIILIYFNFNIRTSN